MVYQIIIDEDQEVLEMQPIYLSSEESEITTPCSSLDNHLPNNIPDSYDAVTQLTASQHEHMLVSGNINLQYPPTSPFSLLSDDDEDKLSAPMVSNLTQNAPYVPNRRPHPFQMFQQLTPISETPESPTPGNRGQCEICRPYDLLDTPTTSDYPLPSVSTVVEGLQKMILHADMETNAYVTDCLVWDKALWRSNWRDSRWLTPSNSWTRRITQEQGIKTQRFPWWPIEWCFNFCPPGIVAGCRLWRPNVHCKLCKLWQHILRYTSQSVALVQRLKTILKSNYICRYEVNRLKNMIGWKLEGRKKDPTPKSTKKSAAEEQKLPYRTVAWITNLKRSNKTNV